jgi:hypothetical protein
MADGVVVTELLGSARSISFESFYSFRVQVLYVRGM